MDCRTCSRWSPVQCDTARGIIVSFFLFFFSTDLSYVCVCACGCVLEAVSHDII